MGDKFARMSAMPLAPRSARLPVTLIAGSLGAGKTTLINTLLREVPERRIGVLVNDFGEVNIDQRLIVGATDEVVSLANGCACCTLRGELMQAVLRVLERGAPPEHLLVEASGVSSPGALLEGFGELARAGGVRVDGVVCLVDAVALRPESLKTEPRVRDQLYASDLVVLNKVDLANSADVDALAEEFTRRVPAARIVRTQGARVPPELILGLSRAERSAAPFKYLSSPQDPSVHLSEYITVTMEWPGPVLLEALRARLELLPAEVFRVKGVVVPVERPGEAWALNAVGRRATLERLPQAASPTSTALVAIASAALKEERLREVLAQLLESSAFLK